MRYQPHLGAHIVIGKKYIVRGRVQRVGFREFVRKKAVSLGIIGSARNLPDGTVAIHAGGVPAALEAFELELHRGPRLSRVDTVEGSPADLPTDGTFTTR